MAHKNKDNNVNGDKVICMTIGHVGKWATILSLTFEVVDSYQDLT